MNFKRSHALAVVLSMALVGCAGSGWHPRDEGAMADGATSESARIIGRFKAEDSSLQRFFDSAHAYAVFPSIGKGGFVVGGAHGEGEVHSGGELVGYSTMTQVSVGLQLGGQEYAELIFFRDAQTFADFCRGNYELSAQASAIAVTAGAATTASYDRGVAIFTMPLAGLMYEASVGGQKFSYTSIR